MAAFFTTMLEIILGFAQGANGFLTWMTTEIQFGEFTIAPWQIISFSTLYIVFAVVVIKFFLS